MSSSKPSHSFGWRPDLPDHRDFRLLTAAPITFPPHMDLRGGPLYDQGSIGSCTANAVASMIRFVDVKLNLADFDPARLFIYYATRDIEGTTASDAGSSIRDAIQVIVYPGTPPESAWPYVESKFAVRPPQSAYDQAHAHEATAYLRVDQSETGFKSCLAAGYVFVIGFTVYENFESAQAATTGVIDMPQGSVIGGHAVMVVGYDDPSQRFLCQNSWGAFWGQGGHFTIPYDYFTSSDLAADPWTIRAVSGDAPQPPVPVPPVPAVLTIKKIKYKNAHHLIVTGTGFEVGSRLSVDGWPMQSTRVDESRYECIVANLTKGPHTVQIVNPDGAGVQKGFTV